MKQDSIFTQGYKSTNVLLLMETSRTAYAKHVMENDHQILWKEARVIKNEPHLTKRKVKESLLIRRTANSMNPDKGLQLDNIWYPSIK